MSASPESALAQLGRRVRSARVEAGLTQEDVAHAAGLNVSYFGKLERGLNNPTAATLIRVAEVVGVDAGELLAGLQSSMLPDRPPRARRGPRRTIA